MNQKPTEVYWNHNFVTFSTARINLLVCVNVVHPKNN